MPLKEQITYFENTASYAANTRAVVETVGSYLKSHRLKHVVAASCTGYVGAKFAPLKRAHPRVNIVAVKMAPAIDKIYSVKVNPKYVAEMDKAGVVFFGLWSADRRNRRGSGTLEIASCASPRPDRFAASGAPVSR